jgi:predicted porin
MIRNIFVASLLSVTATAAAAELTYGTAFAKFHDLDVDGAGSIDVKSLGGGIEYRYDNFIFSGELSNVDIEGVDIDLGTVGVEYALANGFNIGLDYTRFDIEGFDADVTSLFGSYQSGAHTFGAAIGDSSDLDDMTFSIFAAWDVTPTGTVGLDLVHIEDETLYAAYADYDVAQYNVQADLLKLDDLSVVAVAGGYEFANGFSAIGSVGFLDLGPEDVRSITIGGQYEFTPGANVELALGRLDFDSGEDVDQLTFGVNYELGRRTSKRRSLGNIFSSATGTFAGLTDF